MTSFLFEHFISGKQEKYKFIKAESFSDAISILSERFKGVFKSLETFPYILWSNWDDVVEEIRND